MKETILGWVLTYIKDGKRITGILIALLNLLTPKLREWGLPALPEGSETTIASFLAIAVLNAWSKVDASKAAPALPPGK